MFGPLNLARSAHYWKPVQILTSAVSNGQEMEHMSVLVLVRVRSKSGTLRREPSSVACTVMTPELALWVGISTLSLLEHDLVLSSTMMFASPNTRLLSSSPTPLRFVVLNGAQTVLNLQLAETTTWSLFGMLAP